nr:MAG TPA: Major capsid protein [Microviridae sp.]
MAQNIFDATFDANNRIDVNPFDWSHVYNFTTDFGRITPVFCELVPAKGSLRINPEFGLELMPMVFPVQTRMFARLNFFKVTLRSMWEDYSDFISNFRDDLVEPYILPDFSRFSKMCKTGTLGDYLGLPTFGTRISSTKKLVDAPCGSNSRNFTDSPLDAVMRALRSDAPISGSTCTASLNTNGTQTIIFKTKASATAIPTSASQVGIDITLTGGQSEVFDGARGFFVFLGDDETYSFDLPIDFKKSSDGVIGARISSVDPSRLNNVEGAPLVAITAPNSGAPISFANVAFNVTYTYYTLQNDVQYNTYPFATQNRPNNTHLLAYRFRAYESVYNAYYRDIRNNPFVNNGRPVYNKWLPNMKGGADKTLYELHQCNWERDFLTTAVPNPQQGANAPLVGLVMGDVVTRAEDGTYSVQKRTVLVDEDGSKYGLSYKVSEDGERLVGVDYDPVSEKTPVTAINSYAELAALATTEGSGFTIETLRYVNAYQKFLELNMRKGFSYKQIMQGRWDIDIRFDELLMPEFIGGISRELSMRTVEQTVDQQSSTSQGKYAEALGSKTGIAGVYGSTSNNIEVFCDEESYIIGLLTVTPVPIYTQLLPKDFVYNGLLDHYQPEFDRIGFQPITYKEICPMNIVAEDSTDQLNKTFGYQRPWYEYVAKYDSAHGLFRTNMKNFVMHRTFSGLPQLGQQFLLVNPETVNQVFSVTEYTDKIFGYVKFNATARLPISRVAIPRLD